MRICDQSVVVTYPPVSLEMKTAMGQRGAFSDIVDVDRVGVVESGRQSLGWIGPTDPVSRVYNFLGGFKLRLQLQV